MSRKVSEIINQIKPYKAEKIILFGSYAYGKPTTDSDVDLFIFTPQEFAQAKKTNPFIKLAAEHGKVVYG